MARQPKSAAKAGWRRWWTIAGLTGLLVVAVVFVTWKKPTPAPTPPVSTSRALARAVQALESNQPAKAAALLDEVLGTSPRNAKALLYRGQAARLMKSPDEARKFWRSIPDSDDSNVAMARFLEGAMEIDGGSARITEALWRESASRNPLSTLASERLVNLYILQLRADEARARLEELARIRPLTPIEIVLMTIAGSVVENPETAISRLQAYVDRDPYDLASRRALARYLLAADRDVEVADVFEKAPEEHRSDPALREAWVEAQLVSESGSMIKWLQQFWPVPQQPDDVDWWRAYGLCALHDEQWEQAAEALSYVAARRSDSWSTLYQTGRALARLRQSKEAEAAITRAGLLEKTLLSAERLMHGDLRRTDLVWPIVLETAGLLAQQDRFGDARRWYELALRMNPRSSEAREGLARTFDLSQRSSTKLLEREPPALPRFALDGDPTKPHVEPATASENRPQDAIKLVDEASERGLNFVYDHGHSGKSLLLESTGGGVACLDYDGDDATDFFFPQGARLEPAPSEQPLVDALFRQRNGRFEDVARLAGVASPQYGQGVAAADWDNDGFTDLVVGNYGTCELYRNLGDGTFELVPLEEDAPRRWTASLGWGDFDADGDLDLFVVNYLKDAERVCLDPNGVHKTCNPQNYDAEPDQLFENLGDGRFQEISSAAGIIDRDGKGMGLIIADFDDDGLIDIYVSNDGTPNQLYHNRRVAGGGTIQFEEVGLLSGAALSGEGMAQAGMGIACGDLFGNGLLDLYVTNFMDDVNTLYRNEGGMFFADATARSGLATPTRRFLGFGTQAVDLDLDGEKDLFVANGHIGDFRDQGIPWKMRPQVFRNLGSGQFEEFLAESSGYLTGEYVGRGVAQCDWNRDGRPDLVVVHQGQPAALLANSWSGRPAASVRLIGTTDNRDAIGTTISQQRGAVSRRAGRFGSDGYLVTNSAEIMVACSEDGRGVFDLLWPNGERVPGVEVRSGERLVIRQSQSLRSTAIDRVSLAPAAE